MRVTAKVDYAVRAAVALAAAGPEPVKGEVLGLGQHIPVRYLENILSELRQAGLVRSQRGAEGGYWLARPAEDITIADVIRVLEGPLANVRGVRPDEVDYPPDMDALRDVWVAVRASLRSVLETVTLADLVQGRLPSAVQALIDDPGAWESRWPTAQPSG